MSSLPQSVSVIGAGSWGTALAIALCHNIRRVKLWGRDPAAMQQIEQDRCNQKYLPDITLPENLQIHQQMNSLIDDELCFLIVVPSHAFRTTLQTLHKKISDTGKAPNNATLIWGTKGFDPHTGRLLGDVAAEIFSETNRQAVISGPSFASETARALPTALTVASLASGCAESLARWFRTPTIRVYHNTDPVSVQLGGAIKNVMAIAAGISDGLGYGANARAALITRGLSELTRLGIALGGQPETFMGLTGVGDLILTCTDNQSRNRRFGLGIGQGKSVDQITEEIGQEIEGINTVRELYGISQSLDVEMPITEQVYRVLHENNDAAVAVQRLLQRNPKAESM